MGPDSSVSDIVREIASLQPQYSSKNTEAMQRRGVLIRSVLPQALSVSEARFAVILGEHGQDIGFEGRDGIGRKTPAPWVRIFSRELSPSATTGYYMVIHFSVDGSKCFVTVGCASTKWDNERGDLIKLSYLEIDKNVEWARKTVREAGAASTPFEDEVAIGSDLALPKSFEKATAFCKALNVKALDDDTLLETIDGALALLRIIYDGYNSMEDLPSSEILNIEVGSVANPSKKHAASRQGYGLNSRERRAVELHAMELTRLHLEKLGYTVRDDSSNNSYDFLATSLTEEIKVEVKGTTSHHADAILVTKNELDLHRDPSERTAISIVTGIKLENRSTSPTCSGGLVEYRDPSAIDSWEIIPTAFMLRRRD